MGYSTDENLHLVERFRRLNADTLLYEYTVDDPTVWTRPWTVSMTMERSEQPIYEYACHEGNYGMRGILSGARAEEKFANEKGAERRFVSVSCRYAARTFPGGFMSPDVPQPYGAPLALDAAKKIAAPALAEAARNNWAMAVAVVDGAGDLVYFERMDATQAGSVVVAIDKARSAARFKRPTKAFQDVLAAGGDGWRVLGLQGAVPVEGGIPIVIDGKIVGAIGVSGGTSPQDGQCARAGVDAAVQV